VRDECLSFPFALSYSRPRYRDGAGGASYEQAELGSRFRRSPDLPAAQLTAAEAQATRTWVSGVGDEANQCSRTAPCKTFAGAILKTAAGGEINCPDPGGYGVITIAKSMTLDRRGTLGSIPV
jgi:hypothetical protein